MAIIGGLVIALEGDYGYDLRDWVQVVILILKCGDIDTSQTIGIGYEVK